MKKLTLAITYHNEPFDVVRGLMESIDSQLGIDLSDVEFLIMNDTVEPVDIDLNPYVNIKDNARIVLSDVKNNIGLSRQCAIDNCTSPYIMFCDCDDSLSNVLVLSEIISGLATCKDLYHFDFLEEHISNGKNVYTQKGANTTWCFGKVYNVDFIRRNNIRFSEKLKYHEDTYFNHVFMFCLPTQENLNMVGYVWKNNVNSITRSNDHGYAVTSISEYIDSLDYCIEEFWSRGETAVDANMIDSINHLIYSVIGEVYGRVQTFKDKSPEGASIIEARLAKFIEKYDPQFGCFATKSSLAVNDGIRNALYKWTIPTETFYDFVSRIMGY